MSITKDEAKRVARAAHSQQWDEAGGAAIAYEVGYVAGRTAAPTRAEAIAVAKMGIEQDNREGYGWEAWDLIPEDNKELLIEDGLEMLNAAREAVAHA